MSDSLGSSLPTTFVGVVTSNPVRLPRCIDKVKDDKELNPSVVQSRHIHLSDPISLWIHPGIRTVT